MNLINILKINIGAAKGTKGFEGTLYYEYVKINASHIFRITNAFLNNINYGLNLQKD